MAKPLPPASAAPRYVQQPNSVIATGRPWVKKRVSRLPNWSRMQRVPVEVDAHDVEASPVNGLERHRGVSHRPGEARTHPFNCLSEEGVQRAVVLTGADAVPELRVLQALEHRRALDDPGHGDTS